MCDSNKSVLYLYIFIGFLLFGFFLFNQIYGVMRRIERNLIQKVMKTIFDMNFSKNSQLTASTKILLFHIQILYSVISSELQLL